MMKQLNPALTAGYVRAPLIFHHLL